MKKLGILTGLGMALPGLAQTTPPAAVPPAGIRMETRRMGASTPPKQLADERTSVLASQLNLSPEQTAKVRVAELAWARER